MLISLPCSLRDPRAQNLKEVFLKVVVIRVFFLISWVIFFSIRFLENVFSILSNLMKLPIKPEL